MVALGPFLSTLLSTVNSLLGKERLLLKKPILANEDNLTWASLVPWVFGLKSSGGPTHSHPTGNSLVLRGHRAGVGGAELTPTVRGLCAQRPRHQTVWVLILASPATDWVSYSPSLSLSFLTGKMGTNTRLTLESHKVKHSNVYQALSTGPDP